MLYLPRGRPKKLDNQKISLILGVLYRNESGLWLRELSKQTNLHPSTVNFYVERVLSPLLIDERVGNDEKPILRVIRLKPAIIEKLNQGYNFSEIMKYIKMVENIKDSV